MQRRFLQLLTRELFSPSRGLFSYNSGVRTLWFELSEESETTSISPKAAACAEAMADTADVPSAVTEEKKERSDREKALEAPPTQKAKEYWLTGLLASVAVYNDILMPLNLPLVVSCKLYAIARY